jgi:hypothetical protein
MTQIFRRSIFQVEAPELIEYFRSNGGHSQVFHSGSRSISVPMCCFTIPALSMDFLRPPGSMTAWPLAIFGITLLVHGICQYEGQPPAFFEWIRTIF